MGTSKNGQSGTGRIRRFTPEAAGTARTSSGALVPRNDTGLVTVDSKSGTVGSYFELVQNQSWPQQLQSGKTFYTGIANFGVVTLKIWQPQSPPPGTTNPGASYLSVPRFYVTDKALPSFSTYGANGSPPAVYVQTRMDNPNEFLRKPDGSPAYFITNEATTENRKTGYDYVTPVRVPIWVQVNNQAETLKSNGLTIYYTDLEKTSYRDPLTGQSIAPGYTFMRLKVDQLSRYYGGAILEVGLRDIPNTAPVPPAGTSSVIQAGARIMAPCSN